MGGLYKMEPPVDLVHGNILVTGKPPGKLARRRAWAGYELPGTHYDFLPAEQALAFHDELVRFLREFADLPEFHLMMIPEPVHAVQMQRRFASQASGPLSAEAAEYCRLVAEALQAFDQEEEVCRFGFRLFLRLPDPPRAYESLPEMVKAAATDFRDFVEVMVGIGQREIPERHLALWAHAEAAFYARLEAFTAVGSALRFRSLTTTESLRCLRAPFWRGFGTEPPFSAAWAPQAVIQPGLGDELVLVPDSGAMRRLYSGRIDHQEDQGYLKVTQMVDGEPHTAYQAFLTVEQFSPTPMALLGGEWAYRLQREVGPVELHLRWTARDHQRTLDDLASQKRKQDDTSEQEQEHAGGTSADTFRSRSETEEMEAYIKDTRSPSLQVTIVVAVTGSTPEILRQRIRTAASVFNRLDIRMAHNGPDQYKHFVETIPGAARQVDDYVHRLLPPALATCMIGTTTSLLDPTGTFFATDAQGRPLWVDPTRALAVLDTSGSAVAVGPLGKGKSLALNFLAYLAVLLRGARLLAIDSAKPERSQWPQLLPYLGPHTKVVTLSAHEADRGKLDPYAIFPDRTEATNHAVSQAAFLSQVKLNDVGYDVLLRAYTEVRDHSARPCMMAGIQILEQLGRDASYKYREVAERLAERLRNIASMAYAGLIFGDGQGAGIDTGNLVTVLQLDRIRKPPEGKALQDYDLDEYISHAIMVASVAFAHAFARQDRRQPKVILADEIRWFTNNAYGKDLIEQQTLIGRAMGVQVYLVGQNVSHIPQDLHQHFTMRLAFGAASEREAIATLRFLGVEPTQETIDRLMRLNPGDVKGQCLLRDLDGRIGEAHINLLFDDLIRAFETRSLVPQSQDHREVVS